MNFRFFALLFVFVLMYGALGANLYRLQIEKSEYYVNRAKAIQENVAQRQLRRGQIFFTDRAGTKIPVALNRDFPFIYATPNKIKNPDVVTASMSDALGIKASELRIILGNSKLAFRSLVDRATDEQILAVKQLQPEGIYIDTKQYRFYPFGPLASQLVGFVGVNENNADPIGLYGLEKFYNENSSKGDDVLLTIDRNIQAQAEQILSSLIEKYKAVGGTVIVQEPKSGKILALANKPDFDPNEYGSSPVKNFLNPAVQLVYEPGSVIKPITMATGIDVGAISPETEFVDKGSVTLNGKMIRNSMEKIYGRVTMTDVIANSINTGVVYAEQLIGHARFFEYMKKFGFTEKTGIDLPDEVLGNLKNLERKDARAIDFATVAFGQGAAITPLQLVSAYTVLANGGLLMRPYINSTYEPYVTRRVINSGTADKVIKMMEAAVANGKITVIPGYRVAGKTGTAFIPDFKKGGYTEDMIHTFVGFAPATNPAFVALVKVDKPQVGGLAGLTVVTGFRDLAQFILNYYNIPPDVLNVEKQK